MGTIVIQPRLALRDKTDAILLEYAHSIITSLNLSGAVFSDVPLSELKQKSLEYSIALSKSSLGDPSVTVAKNIARANLENILRLIAKRCAEIADGNDALFLLSGFEVRHRHGTLVTLDAPAHFTIILGPLAGTLEFKFKSVKGARAYEIYFGKSETDPDTWELLTVTTSGKILISDLKSGTRFSARVRAIGSKGKRGEWSEIVSHKTY